MDSKEKKTSKMNELKHELNKFQTNLNRDLTMIQLSPDSDTKKIMTQYIEDYIKCLEIIINICETRKRY